MAITSTLPAVPFIPLNVPAEPSRLRRPRGLALGGVPVEPRRFATANPRADGDSELAGRVGKALLQVRGEYAHDDAIMIEHIPPNSTFGQWWSQLGRAMESQQVRDWMRAAGVNTHSLMIAPATGRISYQLTHTAAAQPNGLDDKGLDTGGRPSPGGGAGCRRWQPCPL